ncbi:MAG: GCN5-related N-acetyltransferase [Berkelbacteria bacterium GW2011_GWA1_36_9]|uniref:GCN5-related N-acetyltransferase n=1 Tax=Berkelbacteria bacterium GW2011_GWA1_36_9 TaxID=1618331 RepID=A0A0G0IRC4_9BACT|nr:MAG: GCN5-related N-acetyltransferase [Berkelbacteria bacterium GW2011_GWA1_36_9]
METKTFGDKITIRKLSKGDLKNSKEFLDFINSLVKEEAKILLKKELTLKEEKEKLEKFLESTDKKTMVFLIAEHSGKIVGTTSIDLGRGRKNHIGGFGIIIRDSYRGMGLGKYMVGEVIRLAKKELRPAPKIIQLEVYANNKPAINLYKKMGFKAVARIPKQIQHKGKLVSALTMLKFL